MQEDDGVLLVVKGLFALFFIIFLVICVKQPRMIGEMLRFVIHFFTGTLH